MPADDLVGRVPFHTLRPGIPIRNDAAWVEHINGIVDERIDQQPETTFTREQRFVGGVTFCQVARDLGEADQRAGLVVDRIGNGARPKATAVLAQAPALRFEAAFFACFLEDVLR